MREDTVSQERLLEWLYERLPALREEIPKRIASFIDEGPETWTAYTVFGFGLRTYIEELLDAGDEARLAPLFSALNFLSEHGDGAVKNELGVVACEELDVWRVWRFLGPTLRAWQLETVASFPLAKYGKWTPVNGHVDREKYAARWREEIERIGGWEKLVIENQLMIRHKLVKEFGITDMLAPEPGSQDWLSTGLRWPWPPKP